MPCECCLGTRAAPRGRGLHRYEIGHLSVRGVLLFLAHGIQCLRAESDMTVDVIVWLLSCVRLSVTPWTAAHQASLSFTIPWSLLRLMSFESAMPSNHLILCHPLLLLPSIFPSIRAFPNESALHIRWPQYWSFSFSISPSNEYSGLILLGIDWFDLHAIQRTLKGLLQHHSLKA